MKDAAGSFILWLMEMTALRKDCIQLLLYINMQAMTGEGSYILINRTGRECDVNYKNID